MSAIGWGLVYAGIEVDPLGLFVGLFRVSPYWTGVLFAFLAPVAFTSAAFVVPLTGAAAATSGRGWDYRAFAGFGQGVIGLMIVMAVWLLSGHFLRVKACLSRQTLPHGLSCAAP